MTDDNDKVVDIRTRTGATSSPSMWGMMEQIIASEGVWGTVLLMADVIGEKPEAFPQLRSNLEFREQASEIIRETARRLERLEDAINLERLNDPVDRDITG